MRIIYNPIFENELFHIVNNIAQDKPNASIRFALELEKSILDANTIEILKIFNQNKPLQQ